MTTSTAAAGSDGWGLYPMPVYQQTTHANHPQEPNDWATTGHGNDAPAARGSHPHLTGRRCG